jgi:light-regulated signal transduction histidine kinase (bacteriophytochrome)
MKSKQTMPSYLVQLEHELAAALRKVDEQMELLRLCKEENDEKHKDIIWGMAERAKLMERIKRLEEAGDALANNHNPFTFIDWQKAKEAKP